MSENNLIINDSVNYINGMLCILSVLNPFNTHISLLACTEKIYQPNDIFKIFNAYEKIIDIKSLPVTNFIGDIEQKLLSLFDKSFHFKVVDEPLDRLVFLLDDLVEYGFLTRNNEEYLALSFTHLDKKYDLDSADMIDFKAENEIYVLNHRQGCLILQFAKIITE